MPPGASGSVKTIFVVHDAVGQKLLYQLWLPLVEHLFEEPPDDGLILFYGKAHPLSLGLHVGSLSPDLLGIREDLFSAIRA